MAVPSVELRPRGAVAVLDAALRLCSRRSEVWALALPGGALVAFAITAWVDALRTGDGVLWTSLLLTTAWFARALFQGAACHWVEGLLISPEVPAPRASLRVALAHAPTLFITTAVLLLVNLVTLPGSLGLAVFFLSSHIAAYAVALKEAGHPLAIHATSSRVLGPARDATTGLRASLLLQLLLAINLHIAANFGIWLLRKLLGLELTFLQRYTSFDNLPWVVSVFAFAFALYEPVRAAIAAILVVDGRVRQDGVDLETAIAQLPPVRRSGTAGRAAGVLLALVAGLAAPSARAQDDEAPAPIPAAELAPRLRDAIAECGLQSPQLDAQLEAVEDLATAERASLQRFVSEIETLAYDDGECEAVEQRLTTGLALIEEARDGLAARKALSARDAAKQILARPEFVNAPARKTVETDDARPEAPKAEPGWWERFKRWLRALLEEWFRPRPPEFRPPTAGGGMAFANLIVGALVVAVLVALVWLVLRFRERTGRQTPVEVEIVAAGELTGGEHLGALARAPEGWAHLADSLAAQGQLREAIRHLFLAVLSRLHREGVIDYDPGLSNWDYLRRFRGPDAWRSAYRELTFRFDYAFYGHAELDREGYARVRTLAEPILSAPPMTERRAG